MGVGLGYRGTLNDASLLDALVADVRQFCQKVGWECEEVSETISGISLGDATDFTGRRKKRDKAEEEDPGIETYEMGSLTVRYNPKTIPLVEDTWRGIVAQPPGTESLLITFDSKGYLCHFMPIRMKKGPLKDQPHFMSLPLYCKTTGEMEQHIAICLLLRFLRKKYIRNLKVSDDTDFYKTGDLKKLNETHAMMAGWLNAIRGNPEFLKVVFKAAGIDEKLAETAVPLPNEIHVPIKQAAKKATVH